MTLPPFLSPLPASPPLQAVSFLFSFSFLFKKRKYPSPAIFFSKLFFFSKTSLPSQKNPCSTAPLFLDQQAWPFQPPPWPAMPPLVHAASSWQKKGPPSSQKNEWKILPPLPPLGGSQTNEKNPWSFKGFTNMPLFGRIHECKEHKH